MNALDNENDPFEDVFRNRFADFESEPDFQLWNKIEPQLPVKPTRKIPYWQISAIALIMLLSGLSVYHFSQSSEENTTTLAEVLPKGMPKTEPQFVPTKGEKTSLNNNIENSKGLPINISSPEKNRETSDDNQTTPLFVAPQTDKILKNVRKNIIADNFTGEAKNEIFIEPNSEKNAIYEIESENKAKKYNKKNKEKLNLFATRTSNKGIVENYHKINENIFDVQGNKSPLFNVFNNNQGFSLTTLNSKDYSLLSKDFRKLKLKYVTLPKEDKYFKESKPIDLYFSVMPLLNYYTITPNGNDANYVHGIAVNDDGDRLGFYTQSGVIFTLSERFKLRTGLTFTNTNHSINYQIRTDSLVVQSPDNKGVDVSFAEINQTYSQSANYLGTKIELQYLFLKGEELTHYVNVGVEGAYRLNGNHQLNGFANFAYGVTRQIGDNAYLFVEPTFSYSLNQQSDSNAFLLVKPNKIGFNIGVNFKIK
ncbi:hypothetical protein LV89_03159 [Arcicella aurantiaca]|uniref:Uncharacterized protein n=1 Tax=Arcicella aurantiaca TaxID=591202 RepID=A0A316E1C5_9BACT|nr:hypothetical protein [Arcicella aurantiaca]PWK23342.1 hypothetical protein LV89_03159 [Arcicella aurantiaca]